MRWLAPRPTQSSTPPVFILLPEGTIHQPTRKDPVDDEPERQPAIDLRA